MKRARTRKNPFLSAWLSGANAVAGAVRVRAAATAKRQSRAAAAKGMRQMTDVWTALLTPALPKKRRRR